MIMVFHKNFSRGETPAHFNTIVNISPPNTPAQTKNYALFFYFRLVSNERTKMSAAENFENREHIHVLYSIRNIVFSVMVEQLPQVDSLTSLGTCSTFTRT